MTGPSLKQWMLGLPGHNEVVRLEDVLLLVKGGQLRPTDLVKKLGEPWRAANEVPELKDYFVEAKPGAAQRRPEPPEPKAEPVAAPTREAAGAKTARLPQADSPALKPGRLSGLGSERRLTGRVSVSAPTAAPSAPAPASGGAAAHASAPASGPGGAAAPAAEARRAAEETRSPEPDAKPALQEARSPTDSKPPGAPETRRARRIPTREIPKPRPKAVPVLEPMLGKYFSPVDLLRSASFSFEPKKLMVTAVPLIPLMTVWTLLMHLSGGRTEKTEKILFVAAMALFSFGIAITLTVLAYLTRRQLEGKEYSVGEMVAYGIANLKTAFLYPVLAMFPSLVALGILWLLGALRNLGPGIASALRIAYIIPMFFAFLAVIGSLLFQIASMYVPAAAAIEGEPFTGAVHAAWSNVRRQWGRVVLHWLIVTVAFGVIAFVCVELSILTVRLPDQIFPNPTDPRIWSSWVQFERLFVIYEGLALGLGLTLPVSLFSTLGTLSYISLRHPASEQLSPSPMDETSGIGIQGSRSGSSPMEATQPGETRPAPADATNPGAPSKPGVTPAPDISDDSDEQPLVKES
jgi:hypothetical protein